MNDTMDNKMSQQRLYVLIAAAAGMLGTFLPWVSAPIIGGISGTAGDGWFTFILFGVAVFVALQGDRTKNLDQKQFLAVCVTSGLAALFALWKIINFNNSMGQLAGRDGMFSGMFTSTVSIGVGLYLIVLAGIAVIGLAFKMKAKIGGHQETVDKGDLDKETVDKDSINKAIGSSENVNNEADSKVSESNESVDKEAEDKEAENKRGGHKEAENKEK